MFVVDTNVFLHAADARSPFHLPCHALLDSWKRGSGGWYTTWGVIYEFARVATHPRVFRRPWSPLTAWDFVAVLLESPGFRILTETEQHADVAADVFRGAPWLVGNAVHDAHIAILMREHGIRTIYTRDTAFRRFPFLEVIDPVEMVGDRPGAQRSSARPVRQLGVRPRRAQPTTPNAPRRPARSRS